MTWHGPRWTAHWAAAPLALFALAWPEQAAADTVCVPSALGVPGMPGAPDWWTSSAMLDDPRWHGAARESFPYIIAAGQPEATSRLITTGGQLLVTLQARVDPDGISFSGSTEFDGVYIGFSGLSTDPAGGSDTKVKIVRLSLHPGVSDSAANALSIIQYNRSGGTWSQTPGSPPWLVHSRRFTNTTVSGETIPWAVNLHVDPAALGLQSASLRFWYAVAIKPATVPNLAPIVYGWPTGAVFEQPDPPDNTSDVNTVWGSSFNEGVDDWGNLVLAGTSPECQGISIQPSDIGTTNSPSSWIRTDANNTFRAQLSWNTPSPPVAESVEARFRIANWGSQVGVDGSWSDLPGGRFADHRRNDAAGLISFTCNHDGTDPGCPTLPAGSTQHQCLLVELQGAPQQQVRFLRDSAYHNMDFYSEAEGPPSAEINLAGLRPLPGANQLRDVFVHIKRSNLPERLKSKELVRPKLDKWHEVRLPSMTPLEKMIAGGVGVYEVHVYHDTGKRRGKQQVIAPQVPFGYLVKNEKPVRGYRTELLGLSGDAQKVGTNFYRLVGKNARSLEEARKNPIRVATRIEPIDDTAPADCPKCPECPSCPECPKCPPPSSSGHLLWVALGLVAGFLAGLFVGQMRRPKEN